MPCRLAISSMSLGRAWVHKLPHKLDMAHKYGYQGLELFFEDLEYYADEVHGSSTTHEALSAAAKDIKQMCDDRHISILVLQPFMHYEGLRDRSAHKQKLEKMKLWFKLAKILGTTVIQIPSSFLPKHEITHDLSAMVADLQEVADLGAQEHPALSFAYESLCWGTYIDTWDACWGVIAAVDRPNFGVCLDTFNIAGRVYADPASPTGKTANADADIASSIARLVETVDPKKIFYVQVVDAERLDSPLVEGHPYYVADQPARMNWSRNCRLFYGEDDRNAYLPVKALTKAFLEKQGGLGFEGWVSMELFSRTMNDPAPGTPEEHARRGAVAWEKMKREITFEAAGGVEGVDRQVNGNGNANGNGLVNGNGH